MTTDEVRRLLIQAGEKITGDTRLGNNTGDQLRTASGAILNIFDSGKVQVQGKEQERMHA